MKPVEIAKNVFSVGVTDWNIRDFHGYSTHNGTTYNAFLIVGEKTVLIDTVKQPFADQLIDNIASIIDPRKIDAVISNHTEMDHSGGLARVMHRIGEDKPLYCSKMGLKALGLHFTHKWNYQPVAHGEELPIGERTLVFMETRMLHWPDSMFTYLKEDRILFSSDGFGQHYAGHERFDDEIGDAIMTHAKKYFANILLLYTPKLGKLIAQVKEMGLPIDMICPDHGIIWRKDPGKIITAYETWCRQEPQKKAVVIYDTMWHSTQKMAEAVVAGIAAEGVPAVPIHIRSSHRSEIMTEVMDAGAVVVGSPTLNNNLFPTVADVLTYIKGLKPLNKIGASFGSYGWSGEAVKQVTEVLESMNMDIVSPGVRAHYVPDSGAIAECEELGRSVARALIEKLG
ncbi:MAG: flavodoxin domain-containing protein [Pseudomonadota bacterium]